jgi:hypothetical protein
VNLIRRTGKNFVFHISPREKRLLFEVLELYPLIPAAHHRVSRTAAQKEGAESQKLLDEALAERKRGNKRELLAMLNGERWLRETGDGHQLTLGPSEIEWLLQVLNDIRVGSWLVLGEPDERKGRSTKLNAENLCYFAALEFCDLFQMRLLDAFERRN